VLHTIVEGEPGIFPDPVARVMRKIGGWFDRRKPVEPTTDAASDPAPAPGDGDAPSDGEGHSSEGHSAESK
jgi:hypothetical protein